LFFLVAAVAAVAVAVAVAVVAAEVNNFNERCELTSGD
jgi:hypothetical protein